MQCFSRKMTKQFLLSQEVHFKFKVFQSCLIFFKVCDIISMLHKLNIRISGICIFIGIFVPFFIHNHFELGKIASSTKWLW